MSTCALVLPSCVTDQHYGISRRFPWPATALQPDQLCSQWPTQQHCPPLARTERASDTETLASWSRVSSPEAHCGRYCRISMGRVRAEILSPAVTQLRLCNQPCTLALACDSHVVLKDPALLQMCCNGKKLQSMVSRSGPEFQNLSICVLCPARAFAGVLLVVCETQLVSQAAESVAFGTAA